jgi:hypothetical protein
MNGPAVSHHDEEVRGFHCELGRAVPIEPSQSLPKTGVFGIAAGDFREFQPPVPGIGSPETDSIKTKARHKRAFLKLSARYPQSFRLLG